jgi:membrane protein
MSSFVDAITRAHEQYLLRNPVWQRLLALLLYVVGLVTGIVALPIIAVGPERPARLLLPDRWEGTVVHLLDLLVSPPVVAVVLLLALTTLYKVALPLKPPWWRGLPGALLAALVFLIGAGGLRVYLNWLTGTGYTYGALGAPIAFLLATFFIGMAIVLGAHFNASIQALWPVPLKDRRNRLGRAKDAVSPSHGAAEPVVSQQVPDVLLTPDVKVLERAVRERPDVAVAVLTQLRYDVAPPTGNGAAARVAGEPSAAGLPPDGR